jgi:fluoride ion exporter CrcB/FEX
VATVVGTGLIGAYTTFSSFARDAAALWEKQQRALSVAYVLGTVAACIGAASVALVIFD